MTAKLTGSQSDGGATTGYESEAWAMADASRVDEPAEYKHLALGLILLKYMTDASEERRKAVLVE